MRPLNALFLLLGTTLALLAGIAWFNYSVDPQCFYSCRDIDPHRPTLNNYYQVGQIVVAHPDTELIILGSSRGQTTPPLWVQEVTGLKTLNLASSGAEFATKLAFINIALEKAKIKKIIWMADYFELASESADVKIKNTPALRKYLGADVGVPETSVFSKLQALVDHNTTEASIYFKQHQGQNPEAKGAGSNIDYKSCASPEFKGHETAEGLKREVEMLYQNYTRRVLVSPQNPKTVEAFEQEMRALATKGIEVLIVVTPYHPEFLRKMQAEFPEMYQRQLAWIEKLKSLKSEKIQVVDVLAGIPGGDGSPAYWNDGVHFTCKGAMQILEPLLRASSK